jgi:hypothetical protein
MVTKLIVTSGKSAGRAISVKRNRLLIGRAEDCDIRPLSEDVSRRHCAVIVGPAAVWVEDLGSRNGTFVDGNRITGKVQVADGAMIRVGSLELKVACSDPSAKSGSEDDVSRWLMADEQPAGMFDTTQTMPAAKESAGTTLVAGSTPPAGIDLDHAGTSPDHAHADADADADAAVTQSSSSLAIEALKAGKAAKPGTLPTQQSKKGSDSSRDAAAEALKRFFDNR